MAADPALLAIATRAADAADAARDAAQDVALQLKQIDARVQSLESAARVGPVEGADGAKGSALGSRVVEAIISQPNLLLYGGVSIALALSGSAVVSMAARLLGGSHAP